MNHLFASHDRFEGAGCQTRVPSAWTLLFLAVLMLAIPRLAGAQAQNTGTIFGSVLDPSGAVVPNASIDVQEPEKGIARHVTSSKSGEYLVPSLPVGTYDLTVSATGFEKSVESSITVDADKSVKLVVKLTVGSAKETVEVDAGGSALDTRSATIGTLIDNKLVEELPIDGRNVVALAGLLPGVTDLNAPATNTNDQQGPTYSVSGSRNTQNLMLFDGLMWNNLFYNTGINYPPPNALQEISVLLNNFKAQYGRNAGSVFNVVTKSGTNKIHGAVWDYVQNQAFNASDYLSHANPKDTSNQLGFSVQGPIIRDKLFYAATFQDLIQRLTATGVALYAQGLAERGLVASGSGYSRRPCITPLPSWQAVGCASYATENTANKFYNPKSYTSDSGLLASYSESGPMLQTAWLQSGHTGQNPCDALLAAAANGGYTTNLPNSEIPIPCLNPVLFGNFSLANPLDPSADPKAAGVINHYVPLPNSTSLAGAPEAITTSPQPRNDRNVLLRIDWVVNTHHTIDARYNLISANDATAPGVNSQSLGVATFEVSANAAVSNFGNIGDTWVITNNLLNTFRLGYKRYVFQHPPLDHNTWNTFGGNFAVPGTAVMPMVDVSNDYNLGSTSQANAHIVNENIELLEQLSWTKGRHNWQFGVNFLRLQYLNVSEYPGMLKFATDFTDVPEGDLAFGLPESVTANSALVQGGVNHSVFTYLQDDWRMTPKLTANLGIRYELPFQWYQPNGHASTFIPGHQSTVFPGAITGLAFPGDRGVLPSLVPTDFNGVAPRIGLVYDVFGSGRFVVRGGFGVFFDAINADVVGEGEPYYYQYFQYLPPGGASVPLQNTGDPSGGVRVVPSGYDPKNPQFLPPYTLFYPDRNFRTPYYEGTNFGFQARTGRGGVLDINYVGKFGRKLTMPVDQNPSIYDCTGSYFQINPLLYCTQANSSAQSKQARLRYTPFNYGGTGLVDFESIGNSNYNGLQVQFQQRGGKRLTFTAAYTYSKSIDLSTSSTSLSNSIPDTTHVSSERGLSDYDARHILNMGWVLRVPTTSSRSAFLRTVLNGWQYSGKFSGHSGRPFTVTMNQDSALNSEPNQRASIVPGAKVYLPANRHRIDKVKEYFNVNAFNYPATGTFSNVPRNAFIGPGYLLTDMGVGRSFALTHIREGMRFMVRAEAYNVFNTPNLANPNAHFSCSTSKAIGATPCPSQNGSSTFGQILSTYGNNANTSTNGRKMQFSGTIFF